MRVACVQGYNTADLLRLHHKFTALIRSSNRQGPSKYQIEQGSFKPPAELYSLPGICVRRASGRLVEASKVTRG